VGNEREMIELLEREVPPATVTLVATLGSAGTKFTQGKEWVTIPAVPPTLYVDALGAGDAFLAGLLHSIGAGLPIANAVAGGNVLGSYACTTVGPSFCETLTPDKN